MRTPKAGTIAAIIAEHGIDVVRGMLLNDPIAKYVSSALIDKLVIQYSADGDPMAKGAWKERLYGGMTPDANQVVHIYPNDTVPARQIVAPAPLLAQACDALFSGKDTQSTAKELEAMLERANVPYSRPTPTQTQCALVVLSEGGVMDVFQTGPGPAIVDTIDCQNGLAGDIFSMPAEFTPVMLKAFGQQDQWPSYVRIAAPDDIDVKVIVADPEGSTVTLKGVYSAGRCELMLGDMDASAGYESSYALIQSVSFDDGRKPLHSQQNTNLWDYVLQGGASNAVVRLSLPSPLEDMFQARAERERGPFA